jgi:transcriptional regulator with XRE-family HTH domain
MTADPTSEQLLPGIGERLRQARQEKGLSLRAFARSVGVSPSLVSQIELGKALPSVGTLYAIASKLETSIDDLFADPSDARGNPWVGDKSIDEVELHEDGIVLRKANRPMLNLADGVHWERLTPEHDLEVDFLQVTYGVGAETCPADALMTHSGKEYGVVLSGRLGATVGFSNFELDVGDSICFESTRPHRFWTAGDEPTSVLWTVVRRVGDPRFPSGRAEG